MGGPAVHDACIKHKRFELQCQAFPQQHQETLCVRLPFGVLVGWDSSGWWRVRSMLSRQGNEGNGGVRFAKGVYKLRERHIQSIHRH